MIQERRSLFAAGEIDQRGRDSLAGDFGRAEPIGQPATFGEAFTAARRDQTETRNHNVRQFETENELWERHRQIEAALGRDMPLPHSLTGEPTDQRDGLTDFLNDVIPADRINAFILGRPGSLSDEEYERQVEALREEHPEAFRAIETRDALQRRLAERWLEIRAQADTSAASGGWGAFGSFTGSMVGAFQDPPTAAAAIVTGGAGASRPLIQRMLIQGALGAGYEAFEAPDRAHDAAVYGGPEYSFAEGATDVLFGGLGPVAFEAGGAALRLGTRPARQALGLHADPVVSALSREIDRSSRAYVRQALADSEPLLRSVASRTLGLDHDERLIGGHPGEFDAARASLAAWSPPSAPEPIRDLSGLIDTGVSGAVTLGGRRFEITPSVTGSAEAPQFLFEPRRGPTERISLGDDGTAGAAGSSVLARSVDGWTRDEIRLLAMLWTGRADGASAVDMARFVQSLSSRVAVEDLPLSGPFADTVAGLARLSQATLKRLPENVEPGIAGVVGEMAPSRADLHDELIDTLATAKPRDRHAARLLVRGLLLADDWRSYGLGGEMTPAAAVKRAGLLGDLIDKVRAEPETARRLLALADAADAWGYARPRSIEEAEAGAYLALASVLDRLLPQGIDAADALQTALRAADDSAVFRTSQLAPRAPSSAARGAAAAFSEPGGPGQRLQAVAKPDEAEMEAHPDWDDLAPQTEERRAVDVLRVCVPGGGGG